MYPDISLHQRCWSTKKADNEYEKLEEEYAEVPAEVTTSDEVEEEEGPVIDFAALKAVNEDIIGWLVVEALDISYPIVQSEDNDFYLHRTTEKTYNFAGSIFLDYMNKPDFSDCHSIVYGHNMKNGSMFGTLKQFRDKDVYSKSMYFWICTPEKIINTGYSQHTKSRWRAKHIHSSADRIKRSRII